MKFSSNWFWMKDMLFGRYSNTLLLLPDFKPGVTMRVGLANFQGGVFMTHRRILASALALMLVVIGSVSVLKASVTGSISGTVADPTGAAVPGAKVTLHNPDTGLRQEVTTGSDGGYEFL